MLNDLRYAVRMLMKSPGFTIVAVITLALGIGANTSIFTLIDAVLLKPLPVNDPQSLYIVAHAGERGRTEVNNFPFFEQLRDHSQSFDGLVAFNPNQWKVTLNGETEIVAGQLVTGNYYNVLGVHPLHGRVLAPDDDKAPGAHPVAVISHSYWQRRFGEDPGALGKTITVNLVPFTIVGITPPGFYGLQAGRSTDISIPMSMHSRVGSGARLSERRFWWNLPIVGRLKPGVAPEQARAELDLLQQRFVTEAGMGAEGRKALFSRTELIPARSGLAELGKTYSSGLLVLMGMVGIVLLIACANVGNLLLARAITRQKEISIRLALGAGQARLVRQLLTESLLLSLLGGAVGLLFAWMGTRFLVSFIPPGTVPLTLEIQPDLRVLGFTAAVALLTGFVFGLAPSLRATQVQLGSSLKEKARFLSDTSFGLGMGRVLIISQIALSLILLIGAGLLVRSMQRMRQVETGFRNSDRVLLCSIDCYGTGYRDAKLKDLHRELLERLNSLPGIDSASLATASPMGGTVDATRILVPGFDAGQDDQISINVVAPRYFQTMGIALIAGRDFGPQDDQQSGKVAIVSQSMAQHYFPDQDPLGKRFNLTDQSPENQLEIVGVVSDARFEHLRNSNARMVYVPHQQSWTRPSVSFALQTTGADPSGMIPAVRQAIRSVGSDIPITRIKTLGTHMDETLAQERLIALLSSFFGLLSLLLACIGLYGLMSYATSRRTGEIGIRMALGAQRRQLLQMVMGEGARLAQVGSVVGLLGAFWLTRFIEHHLYGVTPTDPFVLCAAVMLLLIVAMLACYLPARRASRLDPMVALRSE